MANIRKPFNFRNGVQVDDEKLIVSPTGLVGIGTTIPTESLDVRGDAKIVGFATFNSASTPSLIAVDSTLTTVNLVESIIGSGISIKSGIVTSNSATGVVTYYGDGVNLLNLPTSQWLDVDVGLGFTSIYAQGNVGVATVDPRFVFQVGGNADNTLVGFTSGVGISSLGNVLITGVTTSGTFVGVGSDIVDLTASNIAYGLINLDRVPTIPDSKLNSDLQLGIVTTTQFKSTGLEVGVATITSLTGINTIVGVAQTALGLSGTPDIIVGILTATAVAASSFIGGITGDVTGTASTAQSLTQNAVVNIDQLSVGLATVSTRLYASGVVGIGTSGSSADLEVRNTGNVAIRFLGDGQSQIGFGSQTSLYSGNGALTYKNANALFNYSRGNSVELANYGDGNMNFHVDAGTTASTQNPGFYFHQGKSNPIMALTYDGRLGLGVTIPDPGIALEVVGTSTVTDAYIQNTLQVGGGTTIGGSLTIEGDLNLSSNFTGNVIGNLTGNVNAATGISTFTNVEIGQVLQADKLGIGSDPTATNRRISVGDGGQAFVVYVNGSVGIKTESALVSGLNAATTPAVFGGIGIGTDRISSTTACPADFGPIGDSVSPSFSTREFMRVPRVTAAQIAAFTGLLGGEIVYDTDNNVHKGYNGTSWNDLY